MNDWIPFAICILVIWIAQMVLSLLRGGKGEDGAAQLSGEGWRLKDAFKSQGAEAEGDKYVDRARGYEAEIKASELTIQKTTYVRFAVRLRFEVPQALPANWRVMPSAMDGHLSSFQIIPGHPTPLNTMRIYRDGHFVQAPTWMVLSFFGNAQVVRGHLVDTLMNEVPYGSEEWLCLGDLTWRHRHVSFTFYGYGPAYTNMERAVHKMISWSAKLALQLKSFELDALLAREQVMVPGKVYDQNPQYELFVLRVLFEVLEVGEQLSEAQLLGLEQYIYERRDRLDFKWLLPHLRREFFARHELVDLWGYAAVEPVDPLEDELLARVSIEDVIRHPSPLLEYRQALFKTWRLSDAFNEASCFEMLLRAKPVDLPWMLASLLSKAQINLLSSDGLGEVVGQRLGSLSRASHTALIEDVGVQFQDSVYSQAIMQSYLAFISQAPKAHCEAIGVKGVGVLVEHLPELYQRHDLWMHLVEVVTSGELQGLLALLVRYRDEVSLPALSALVQSKHGLSLLYEAQAREQLLLLLQGSLRSTAWHTHRTALSDVVVKLLSYDPTTWSALQREVTLSFEKVVEAVEAHGVTTEDIKMLNALIDDEPHQSMSCIYASTRSKWVKSGAIAGAGALTINADMEDAAGAVSLVDQPDGKLTIKDP